MAASNLETLREFRNALRDDKSRQRRKTIASLLSPEAEFIDASGKSRNGRDEIIRGLRERDAAIEIAATPRAWSRVGRGWLVTCVSDRADACWVREGQIRLWQRFSDINHAREKAAFSAPTRGAPRLGKGSGGISGRRFGASRSGETASPATSRGASCGLASWRLGDKHVRGRCRRRRSEYGDRHPTRAEPVTGVDDPRCPAPGPPKFFGGGPGSRRLGETSVGSAFRHRLSSLYPGFWELQRLAKQADVCEGLATTNCGGNPARPRRRWRSSIRCHEIPAFVLGKSDDRAADRSAERHHRGGRTLTARPPRLAWAEEINAR